MYMKIPNSLLPLSTLQNQYIARHDKEREDGGGGAEKHEFEASASPAPWFQILKRVSSLLFFKMNA